MDRRLQPTLPLLEPDGQTHRRDCDCPRCDAGFRPSEQERTMAARRWEAQQARQAAEVALEKKRARNQAKAMAAALKREAALRGRVLGFQEAMMRHERREKITFCKLGGGFRVVLLIPYCCIFNIKLIIT